LVRAQRSTLRAAARAKGTQSPARKYVEVSRLWQDQITIGE
jgi:hypothetical protein